jgi:hypothetical protein
VCSCTRTELDCSRDSPDPRSSRPTSTDHSHRPANSRWRRRCTSRSSLRLRSRPARRPTSSSCVETLPIAGSEDLPLTRRTQGQGTPPYTINVIATGDANGTSLEELPLQLKPGVFRWTVDFLPGANIVRPRRSCDVSRALLIHPTPHRRSRCMMPRASKRTASSASCRMALARPARAFTSSLFPIQCAHSLLDITARTTTTQSTRLTLEPSLAA